MYKTTLLVTTIAAVAFSAAVSSAPVTKPQVATLARITGSVMVNKGPQYVGGTEGMPLATGERIMTLASASAVLQFDDGCMYTMEENEVVTIPRLSPCVLTKGSGARLGVASPPPPAVAPVVPVAPYPGWVPYAAAGAAAAAIVAVAAGNDDDGKEFDLVVPPPISR